MMEIKHKDYGSVGAFYIEQDNKPIAEMTYLWQGNDIIKIDHTRVDFALRGQGIARQLFDEAIKFARSKSLKIIPLCSYVITVFDREKEFNDVLYIEKK